MRLIADAVLLLHVAIAVFVVGGLVVVLVGHAVGWRWVDSLVFRLAHLAAIAVVVAESLLGVVCPLTTLETWLRARAGDATDGGAFVEHWFRRLLFHDAPAWVFTTGYVVFGLAVLVAWWRFPPRPRRDVVDAAAPTRIDGPTVPSPHRASPRPSDLATTTDVLDRIVRARDAGTVVAGCLGAVASVEALAARFGLKSAPDLYEAISSEQATRVLATVIHRDLAYGVEIVPRDEALRLANDFVAAFASTSTSTRFYSNGLFGHAGPDPDRSASWRPVTDATFDTGVLVLAEHACACCWFEDED